MRVVLVSAISLSALLLLVLILYFTLGSDPVVTHLKLNATCKHENITGICKSKDSCFSNPTTIKLVPCNEGDLSLVCCPPEEMTIIPNNLVQTENIIINNRTKRTPGEKAKEMCKEYGKAGYRRVPNPAFTGQRFFFEPDCEIQEPLIKGGMDAKEKEFPHMVQIGNFDPDLGQVNWTCGGSVVSPEFILSAAHCKVTKEYGYAMVGTARVGGTNEFFEKHVISITEVHVHPHYTANNNDIALFKLSRNVTERPICLDDGSFLLSNNKTVIATGFGLNKEQISSDVLQKVSLNIVDQGPCATKYTNMNMTLPEYPVCAYAEGKDTCGGDSGGPIQARHSQLTCMFTLIGITSFGVNCTLETNLPGVYTNVTPYIEWIEDIVWPA